MINQLSSAGLTAFSGAVGTALGGGSPHGTAVGIVIGALVDILATENTVGAEVIQTVAEFLASATIEAALGIADVVNQYQTFAAYVRQYANEANEDPADFFGRIFGPTPEVEDPLWSNSNEFNPDYN